MAYMSDAITYVMHNKRWTTGLLEGSHEPWLFAHAKFRVRIGTPATFGTEQVMVSGLLKQVNLILPDTLTGATAVVILQDEDGGVIYTSGNLARSAGHNLVIDRVLVGTTTVVIQSSAVELAVRQIPVSLRLAR